MYRNHLAKSAGQPLPYPNVEAPGVVATPWRSFHHYGLAADFNLSNPNDYARLQSMAPQYGLTGIGMSDKGHIEFKGDLASDIAQYHLANWRPAEPARAWRPAYRFYCRAVGATDPRRPRRRQGLIRLSSSPMDIVDNAESRNQKRSQQPRDRPQAGRRRATPQITTGTWTDFAPKAGVDLNQYPNPVSAPRGVQIKVASMIPLNRWASSTS